MKPKKLMIVAHCPSPNTEAMAEAIFNGAQSINAEQLNTAIKSPFDCNADDVLSANAVILFTTENFGYMSGALKDFFERVYYPCLDQPKLNDAKPYSVVIKAGLDGTGTDIALHKITKGLNWKEVSQTLLCKGDFKEEFIQQCHELGQTIAASVDAEII